MSIIVVKGGILSTVQDLGRFGYRRFGINPSGAMDRAAVRLSNELLGNSPNYAVIEMHFPAGEFLFERPIQFVMGGGDFDTHLSGQPIRNWKIHSADAGDVLTFARKSLGNRTYLAVNGGFDVTSWLGSSSTNLTASVGGVHGRRLRAGDRIDFRSTVTTLDEHALGETIIPQYSRAPTVRITAGPEFNALTALSLHTLLTGSFRITTNSDRMGFRLDGPILYSLSENEMLSSGASLGTIQLLPSGQLVVLMADHQTTGGYPRIAVVAEMDLSSLAQLGAGDEVRFELIDILAAQRLALRFEHNVAFLRAGLRLRTSQNV